MRNAKRTSSELILRTSALYLIVSPLLMGGCQLRSYEFDPLEINARYSMKYKEPCSAWLRSKTTGYMYCSSPAFSIIPDTVEKRENKKSGYKPMDSGPTDEASLVAQGKEVYVTVCAACHKESGMGVPGAFPPLAGSGSFYGDPKKHAGIIVHGLNGPITVQNVNYNGAMPAQGQLSDYDIAAVATYERLSWGNNDGVVLPEDVASVR